MNYDFYDNLNMMKQEIPFNQNSFNATDFAGMSNNFDPNNTTSNYSGFNVLNGSATFQNEKNTLNLFDSYEGYLKGNAFKNEYIPYKDYKVAKLNINSEKEEMLINIGEYSFMMHDINLYLDVHPDDQNALRKFIEYRNKVNELITNYERKYGPIGVKGNINNNIPFEWENTSWPWVK